MSDIIVGIGEIEVSGDMERSLVTFGLGSCIALIIYDSINKVAGMAHVALPDSRINPAKRKKMPGYFADTAVPEIFYMMKKEGAVIAQTNIEIKIAGGSEIVNDAHFFRIGERNIEAINKLISARSLTIAAEDTGGRISRNIRIAVGTGEVSIYNPSTGKWAI